MADGGERNVTKGQKMTIDPEDIRKEPMPKWLADFSEGDVFPIQEFLKSRVVFYPGAGNDGHPITVFGSTHGVHCFAFADYGERAEDVQRTFRDECSHYHPISMQVHDLKLVIGPGFTNHLSGPEEGIGLHAGFRNSMPPGGPYVTTAVLGRDDRCVEDGAPARLAILFVGHEAISTYDALFCQKGSRPPYGVVLQDHGFGGNWTVFGGDSSPMWELARQFGQPEWLLVGQNTEAWPSYTTVGPAGHGGMHSTPRHLYRRVE